MPFSPKGGMQTNNLTLFRLVPFAREQRRHPTKSEMILWERLRMRRLGVRFRRQHPFEIGFVVDFYAASARLGVEIDGAVHDVPGARERDEARQRAIEVAYGVRFVRVSAWLVEREVDVALERVRVAVVTVEEPR
jgi:very-short-patch-repair endonuclease